MKLEEQHRKLERRPETILRSSQAKVVAAQEAAVTLAAGSRVTAMVGHCDVTGCNARVSHCIGLLNSAGGQHRHAGSSSNIGMELPHIAWIYSIFFWL